jgi:hypothetical protein
MSVVVPSSRLQRYCGTLEKDAARTDYCIVPQLRYTKSRWRSCWGPTVGPKLTTSSGD